MKESPAPLRNPLAQFLPRPGSLPGVWWSCQERTGMMGKAQTQGRSDRELSEVRQKLERGKEPGRLTGNHMGAQHGRKHF